MNDNPHRRTLIFFCLAITYVASVVYDTLLVKSDERLSAPVAAVLIASMGAAFLFSKYQSQEIQSLILSTWPLHLFTLSFVVVCLAYHGGARFGQVAAYTLVAYATYALLPLLLVTDHGLLRAFAKLIAFSSACLAIPSLFGSLGYESFCRLPLSNKYHYVNMSGIVASGGVFEHAEGQALQMAAGLFCCLYAIRSGGGVIYYPFFCLSVAGLIVSQGRAAMLGVAVALSLRLLPDLFRRSPVVFVGGVVVILIFPFVFWPQLASIPGFADYLRLEKGLSGREEAWQYATTLIEEKPWTGYGFQASSELTELHEKWLRQSGFSGIGTTFHNTFITKTVDLGIIAAMLYALLYLVPLVRICKPSDWRLEQELVRSMILLTLTTAIFRDYNIGGVRSTAVIGTVFLGVAGLWPLLPLSQPRADAEHPIRPLSEGRSTVKALPIEDHVKS